MFVLHIQKFIDTSSVDFKILPDSSSFMIFLNSLIFVCSTIDNSFPLFTLQIPRETEPKSERVLPSL